MGVKNIKTAVAIAKSKGFNVEKEDILNDKELSEALLEASAGGNWLVDAFTSVGKEIRSWFEKPKIIVDEGKVDIDQELNHKVDVENAKDLDVSSKLNIDFSIN